MYMWVGRHTFPTDLFHIRSNRLERETYNHLSPFGVIGGIGPEEKDVLGAAANLGPITMRDNSLLVSCGSVRLTTGNLICKSSEIRFRLMQRSQFYSLCFKPRASMLGMHYFLPISLVRLTQTKRASFKLEKTLLSVFVGFNDW